jgi:hypothetical protein
LGNPGAIAKRVRGTVIVTPNRSGGGGGGGRHGNVGGPMHDEPVDHAPFIETGEDAEIISPEELAASRKSMNLTTLKAMPIRKLVDLAAKYGVENMARSRKQDIIFSLLKAHARQGETDLRRGRVGNFAGRLRFPALGRRVLTSPAPTTSTSAPRRCVDSTYAPATASPV